VSFFILLASTALTFFLVAYSGDPLADLFELRGPTREAKIEQRTRDLNLDQPVWIRYLLWLGDVGRCISPFGGPCTLGNDRLGGEVLPQLQTAIASTLRLVVVATILAVLLGVVTGVVTALRQYSVFDYGVTFVAFLCFSLPVFWISTLLKQYVAIDLNTWLNNPTMTTGGILLLGAIVGGLWALVIGGDRRRIVTVFVVGLVATSSVVYVLLVTDFFVEPYFGILGILVFGVAAAVGWTSLFAGLQRRARPVLISAVATAVAGAAIAFALQGVIGDGGWLVILLVTLGLIAVGWGAGAVLGNPARRLAMRVSAVTGFTVAVLVVVDQLLRAYPALFEATGGRPIKTTGSSTPNLDADFWATQLDLLMYLILPTLALMLASFALYTRYTRASMLDVLGQDYVRTARAKGLNNRTVVVRHAFRNALIPLATLMAFDFAAIFSGAIITETVFGWSGLGKLFTTALGNVDPNPVMAFFLVSATAIVLFNLVADISYAYLDPRIRLG
jgi:peptide/nickel transport system permease protein